ncbi:hypothetical protein NDU88_001752 [Pleurodeles waltl]|uniref:Uncharacterized protein n=1 Tax=Pleurodeles waltl TaxID=8319 RepID=A0AAV7TIP5_PLEWA|nr:hypothetical protein NDU88_001752 [Pleurodeles waltl]
MGGTHAVDRCQLPPISALVPLFGLPVRPLPDSQIQAPATAKAQSSIRWGTHPLSSPLSVLMGVHLFVFVIFSQESVVPQGVRWLRGPLTPDSWPGSVRYVHLSQGATHGDPCSTTGPPQMTHSVRQPITLPFPCPGTPIGPSTIPLRPLRRFPGGRTPGRSPSWAPSSLQPRPGPQDPLSGLAPQMRALPHLDRQPRSCCGRPHTTRPRLSARGGAASLPSQQ